MRTESDPEERSAAGVRDRGEEEGGEKGESQTQSVWKTKGVRVRAAGTQAERGECREVCLLMKGWIRINVARSAFTWIPIAHFKVVTAADAGGVE